MIGIDPVTALALGWMFARRNGSGAPAPVVPSPGQPPPTTPAGTVPFPGNVTSTDPQPGFVKAVEVWRINSAGIPGVLVGAGADDAVVAVREREFPKGWQSVPQSQVTQGEMARAVALLSSWKKGNVRFEGARTIPGRRAFVMTEHPRRAVPSAPSRPAAPPPTTIPASFPTPAPQAPPPRPAPSAPMPAPMPTSAVPAGPQTTAVRPGEGLINIVRRVLGTRDQDQRWIELRTANVPNDADGRPRQRIALTADHPDAKGGILPRLAPGQRLFIPPSWGLVDPARL
jgi:hypothetical protein